MQTAVEANATSRTRPPAVEGRSRHPYDRYRQPGDPLRPPPPRVVFTEDWYPLVKRLLSPWRPVTRTLPLDDPFVALMNDHYWEGDRLMDDVALMFRKNKESRRLFEQALNHGIESLESPPPELTALFAQLDRVPEWVDPARVERGGVIAANVSSIGKLSCGMANNLLTVLGRGVSTAVAATGRLVNDAARRSLESTDFMRKLCIPGALGRFGPARRDAVRVRLMHAQIRMALSQKWGPEHFAQHGNPVSDTDTAQGIPGFGIMAAVYDQVYGRRYTREELEDVNMFWGYIGYLMGCSEEIIPKNLDDALTQMQYGLLTMGTPSEKAPDMIESFERLQEIRIASQDTAFKRWIAKHVVVPVFNGIVFFNAGPALASTFLRIPKPSPIGRAFPYLVIAYNRILRLLGLDRKPYARQVEIARNGDPFFNGFYQSIKRLMEAQGRPAKSTFTGHDNTTAADLKQVI